MTGFIKLLVAAVLSAFFVTPTLAGETIKGREFRLAGDAAQARIVVDFDQEPNPRWFLLRNPHRLVVDLPQTDLLLDPEALKARGLVKNVRFGSLNDGVARLILTANGPFDLKTLAVVQNESQPGYRISIDLSASSERSFEAALADQALTTGATQSTSKGDRLGETRRSDKRRFTIVVDAGHGGIDGGAESAGGTVEKTITLAFAKELKTKLDQLGSFAVYMTREGDEFLSLDQRVVIARQHEADLFISIHADTIRLKGIRGATVYTVSDTASDAEAAATADRENLSDALAGIEIQDENKQVADILVDLIRRETHTYSVRFARSLVGKLSDTVELINNPHRSAGFKVLKAPDVPSVLVELGYLSNAKDEQQLLSAEWRSKAADRIIEAISAFADAKLSAGQ